MRKSLLLMICALLMLACSFPACAEPVLTRNGYTAYLGENNHLYLRDPDGVTRVLRHPVLDLVSINDTELFCLTEDGQLYGIMLDASGTRIISAQPDEATLDAVAEPAPFTLENGVLTVTFTDGTLQELSRSTLAAASNGTTVYYVESVDDHARLAYCDLAQDSLSLTATTLEIGTAPTDLISMTATEDAVTMVLSNQFVSLYHIASGTFHSFPGEAETTTVAFSIADKLIRLHQTETDGYIVESVLDQSYMSTVTPTPAPTPVTTFSPTATPTVTATPKPATSTAEDDGRIRFGTSGSAVRKMQKRLAALGYPVGSVDGSFGENTLRAVRLFQASIGYTQRSYASESMLNKLYSSKAPAYDRYAPLESGDKGEPVRILQEMLFDFGFLGKDDDEIDGKYGPVTANGVKQFQQAWQLDAASGKADKVTMEKLCSLYDQFLDTGKVPHPAPSEPPVPPTDNEPPATEPDTDAPNTPEQDNTPDISDPDISTATDIT